ACSWQDGCGIRTNKEEESNGMSKKTEKQIMLQSNSVHNGLQNNEVGFLELSGTIQNRLDRLDSQARIHFLKEVFDSHFVYEVRDRDSGEQRFFQQSYEVQENGEVDLEGSPQEVRRNIEFVPLQQNAEAVKTNGNGACSCSMKRTKFNNNSKDEDVMSNEEKSTPSGDVMEKVVSLIANEHTRFNKTDRNWLLQLNEEQLDKFEPTEAPEPEVTREQALQALAEDLSDVNKLTDIIADDIKEQVENGIKAYKENRQKLIKSIQANTDDVWKAEKLEAMDTETLENLEKTSRKTDYSGNGVPVQTNAGDVELMLPAGMELESN
ncbi:MAG: hypothetical protein WD432_00755, partial [Candidatus Saccharimonadales bacterium]